MTKEKLLFIIEDAFDNHIEALGWSDDGTPMADLVGKNEMLSEIREKLEEEEEE